jgi:hypothetical protein
MRYQVHRSVAAKVGILQSLDGNDLMVPFRLVHGAERAFAELLHELELVEADRVGVATQRYLRGAFQRTYYYY